MVEVIKQVEPSPLMTSAKPRIQGEIYSSKSCASVSDERESMAGVCFLHFIFDKLFADRRKMFGWMVLMRGGEGGG